MVDRTVHLMGFENADMMAGILQSVCGFSSCSKTIYLLNSHIFIHYCIVSACRYSWSIGYFTKMLLNKVLNENQTPLHQLLIRLFPVSVIPLLMQEYTLTSTWF